MTDAQQAVDDAIKRCTFLRSLLRKKGAKQVWADAERTTIKATCLAWFNTQKPKLVRFLDASALVSADLIYGSVLKASDKAGSRAQYIENLKRLHSNLLDVRSALISAVGKSSGTTDVPPDFSALVPDSRMQEILARRWGECVTCLNAPAPMAATVMMGGLLEGLLLARINKETDKRPIYTASSAPRDRKTGKTLLLKEWMLNDFIEVAHELKWIGHSAKSMSVVLRDYRNFIHPQKEHSHNVELTPDDARMLWDVAKAISKQLVK